MFSTLLTEYERKKCKSLDGCVRCYSEVFISKDEFPIVCFSFVFIDFGLTPNGYDFFTLFFYGTIVQQLSCLYFTEAN